MELFHGYLFYMIGHMVSTKKEIKMNVIQIKKDKCYNCLVVLGFWLLLFFIWLYYGIYRVMVIIINFIKDYFE